MSQKVIAELARYSSDGMKDRRVCLDGSWLNDLSCAGYADSGEVVSFEVDNHVQFGLLFCAACKLLEILCVYLLCLRVVGPIVVDASAGSLDRFGTYEAVRQRYEHFG